MRIVTKLLASLAIITMIAAGSISILIIQNPFEDNPPSLNINDKQLIGSNDESDEDNTEKNDPITDLRFYGTWERSDDFLNITNKETYLSYCLDDKVSKIDDENQNTPGDSEDSEPLLPSYRNPSPEDNMTILEGEIDIDSEKQKITLFDNGTNYTYTYMFSNDNNTLTLTNTASDNNYVYQRKIYNVNSSEEIIKYYYQKVNVTGIVSSDDFTDWLNLTLSDQSIVPINLSDNSFDFSSNQGKTVSFNANVIPYDTNQTWNLPDNNCSCYLSNIDTDSVIIKEN
jgi:hypothetical protein